MFSQACYEPDKGSTGSGVDRNESAWNATIIRDVPADAAQRRVRNPIGAGELAQRLAGQPAPQQLRVGNEPAQTTTPLHSQDSSL